jgi:hypothetical protein
MATLLDDLVAADFCSLGHNGTNSI